VKLKRATKKDWAEIRRLIELYPNQLMQENIPRPEKFFVAKEGRRIVGCCALDIYSPRIAEVRSLAVLKCLWGRGIGKRLVEACIRKARAKKIYELFAITSKTGLFKQLGFDTFQQEKTALFKKLGS